MASPTITSLPACIVRPTSPTPPHHMFLAAIDILWRWFHYNQYILFFKLAQPSAKNEVDSYIAILKSSLALALVEFFPLAGSLFEQPDGRLALDCNDAGVPFIEASIDIPFSSLEADGFQHRPFFRHVAPLSDVREWTPHLPLLSVQVTRFPGDEGFVIGIAYNHTVADGTSFWHFMKSWGECARGLPIALRPIHMRDALRPENLILPPAQPHHAADGQGGHAANAAKSVIQGEVYNFAPRDLELVQRDFHFTADMVNKLKHIAVSSSPTVSSLQALSAHIWRHVTAARGVDKSRKSAFLLPADMRHRCVPPLPTAYFGNAILTDAAIAVTHELQEESIGRTAMRIQELVASLDDTKMKTDYGYLEVLHKSKIFEGLDFKMARIHVSNSPRFPVYEVDFGWGSAVCVRTPHIRTEGEMVLLPGREGGGSVDMSIALSRAAMDKLEQDEGFVSFIDSLGCK